MARVVNLLQIDLGGELGSVDVVGSLSVSYIRGAYWLLHSMAFVNIVGIPASVSCILLSLSVVRHCVARASSRVTTVVRVGFAR